MRKNHKNNLEWFVTEGIIVPIEEKRNIGYTHLFSNPSKLLKEYTFLLGKYREDKQDFLVGRQLDGSLVLVHYPSLDIYDTPTRASYHFVTSYINEDGIASKSKYGGFQYLRIAHPSWEGLELREYSTLSDIHDTVMRIKEQKADKMIDIDDEEDTEDEMEGFQKAYRVDLTQDQSELARIIREMERGETIELTNEVIEQLLELTDPEKYKSNKGYA